MLVCLIFIHLSGTEIRIAYDEAYLYVSGVINTPADKISAPTFKRDALGMDIDHICIILDTFRDNENALMFVVTPSGSRTDLAISNDAQGDDAINTFWDSIWEAQTQITDSGWTVEMRIPFSSLRYESNQNQVEMGMIVYNYTAHDVSMEIFPAIPPQWGFWSFTKPSQSREIFFENIENHNPKYFTPYLLGGMERAASQLSATHPYQHSTTPTREAGLDMKTGLTNNITLDLTLNTDFAQVEADDQQINLTRFSLFFPERRQFFLERAAIFNFSFGNLDRLFYSRRIGLSEGQQLRILGGARVIARAEGWDVGVLSMQTDRAFDQPSENHSVVRFRKQLINPQSYAGGMITSKIDLNGNYNLGYGMDGIFRLWGDDFLNINIAQTLNSDSAFSLSDASSLRVQADWQRRTYSGISYALNYNYSGISYDPAMGFQLRRNYMRFGDRISYGWMPSGESAFHRVRLSVFSSVYLSNETRQLETSEIGPSLELTWKKGALVVGRALHVTEQIHTSFNLSKEVEIPSGSYQFAHASAEFHTPRGKALRAIFVSGGGGFFDGRRFTLSVQPQWSISRVVDFGMYYQYNNISFDERGQQLIAHIARVRAEFTFNTKITFTSFVQYNNTINLGVINARFRYNPRDGTNFYLVFNEILNSNRLTDFPPMPLSMNRTVLLKYNHTLIF